MQSAVKRFNSQAIKEGKSLMKIVPYIYKQKDNKRFSKREFKLINVPPNTSRKEIDKAISCILGQWPFFTESLDENNDIHLTVQNEEAADILSNTWSIGIKNMLIQLAPAFFKQSHLELRNHFIAKFLGFKQKRPLADIF